MSTTSRFVDRALIQEPLGIDRRTRARFRLNRSTFCSLVPSAGHQAWWRATVRDISATGIGLTVSQRIEPGTLLAVDLDDVCRLMFARVVHATSGADGSWRIGCRFRGQLTPEELRALL